MNYSPAHQFFVGWDTSKETLNYCVRSMLGAIINEGEVKNDRSSIRALLQQLAQQHEVFLGEFLHCVENTGQYCHPLLGLSAQLPELYIWLEDPLQLNRSMGRQKNKTDIIDARNVSEYCLLHHRKATQYQLPSQLQQQVDFINKMRLRLVRHKQALGTSLEERKAFVLGPLDKLSVELIKQQLEATKKTITELEQRLEHLIAKDTKAARKYAIARSVLGFGPKNTLTVMAITGLFEKIPTAKACASYAGISPHPRQSGKCLKRNSRISRAASKELKTAIHQGAKYLITPQCDSPFKDIYQRLRLRGRTYNQAINAVRNKMITVLYACLQKDTMYEKKVHQSFG